MAVSAGAMAVLLVALLSLGVFNRDPIFDISALYFFGAYALGMLAFWASREVGARRGFWLAAMAVLGALALALDFRGRIVVALVSAFGLVGLAGLAQGHWLLRGLQRGRLQQLGRISYSVFLIHFPVCLLVNAVVSHFWPTQLGVNALGMLLAVCAVIARGAGAVPLGGVRARAFAPGRFRRLFSR